MGQKNLIVSLVFISIFTIAIVSFAINFASDNSNTAISLGDDSDFSALDTSLKSNVATMVVSQNGSLTSFAESEAVGTDQVSTSGGLLKSAFGLSTLVTSLKTIIGTIQNKIFGGKGGGFGAVTNLFVLLFGFIFVIYAYKTWWGKNPD